MKESAGGSRKFRSDINGLRAWAVLAVVCYHFSVPGFGGGFVGVDVFFVISGFLMTDIVIRALEQQRFSLLDFYGARGRRIVPALLVMCAVLLVLGWFVLLPRDYKALASHTVYALGFLSNVEFWQEAGYFDAASHEKWLLHTWSLSVEWQFYLLWPLVMVAAWQLRPGRAMQRCVVTLLLVVSLAASIVVTSAQPSTAFFLLHTRAWEMLAGAAVLLWTGTLALAGQRRRSLALFGLGLIALAILLFDRNTIWPSWRAALPVAGAIAVLVARSDSLGTAHPVFQWIGTRSYSIYLWHWPIVVALEYLYLREDAAAIGLGMAASVLLGHLSYAWIERGTQLHLQRQSLPFTGATLVLSAVLVASPAITIWRQQGVEGRFAAEVNAVAAVAQRMNPETTRCAPDGRPESPSCVIGGTGRRIIAVGDSHVSAVISSLAQAHQADQAGVVWWGYSGCLYAEGLKVSPVGYLAKRGSDYRCTEFVEWTRKQLERTDGHIPVVIINRYAGAAFGNRSGSADPAIPAFYASRPHGQTSPAALAELASAITAQACQLARQRPVYMVRPIPEMSFNVPKRLARRMSFGLRDDISIPIEEYRRRNDWVWAAQDEARARCGVRILDPTRVLCRDGRCYGSEGGQPLYYDDNHLSEHGSRLLVPMFKEVAPPA